MATPQNHVDLDTPKSKSSVLDHEHPSVDLTWSNLIYTVEAEDPETKKKYRKQLLKDISGTARKCRTLAIMGPSGAGKSTLLTAIGGRIQIDKTCHMDGTAYMDNVLISAKYKPMISFVAQDDIVMGKDTPREALTFSYRLRSGATAEEAAFVVEEMLERLSLVKCADTILGVPGMIKGVSGGEKKRTNIGSELINNPTVLLLDEPTTGLDSVNAFRVGQLIRELANDEKRTVLCTIHSPSSELYDLFDDILLLSCGHTIYLGPRSEAPAYFETVGFPVPRLTNPSEYFMEVLQNDSKVIEELAEKWKAHCATDRHNKSVNQTPDPAKVVTSDPSFDNVLKKEHVSLQGELLLLTSRSWRVTRRDPAGTIGKLVQTLFFAVFLALFYANLERNDSGVQDRAGILFMMTLNMTFMNVMSAITTFPPERAVFLQEQSNALYSAVNYYFSKVIAGFPFTVFFPTMYCVITYFSWDLDVSATGFFNFLALAQCISYCSDAFGLFIAGLFPNPQVSMTLTPLLIMPQMIVGGLFANTERLEPYWVWLNYLSFPRYGFKGLMVNEFDHIGTDLCDGGSGTNCRFRNGEEVLRFYGFDKDTDEVWFSCLLLILFMILYRILGAFALYVQGQSRRSQLVFADNFKKAGGHAKPANSNAIEMAENPVVPPRGEENNAHLFVPAPHQPYGEQPKKEEVAEGRAERHEPVEPASPVPQNQTD